MLTNIKINEDRLWNSLNEMALIGATDKGGVNRQALTDLDKESRDLFVKWCKEENLSITIDQMGNIFARRDGLNPNLPVVLTGSHLDTQPLGGRFDGAFGVLAGLEVMRSLNDANADTVAPLEVVVWTDEEGCRFAAGCMGVSVFVGKRSLKEALSCKDNNGVTLGAELKRIGFNGRELCGGLPVASYFEAHIEQGPILYNQKKKIGIVKGVQAITWLKIELFGESNHAGTTPIINRNDPIKIFIKISK